MVKKSLFIDGQVLQSAAWDRGMGKYSLALIQYMLLDPDYEYDSTYIIFTKHMLLNKEVLKLIRNAAPKAKILILDLYIPEDPSTADVVNIQKINEHKLNTLLEKYAPAINRDFIIMSLFIDQVCSVFPDANRKILLFYDLIPFQYVERYGNLTSFPNYIKRFKTLFEADIIWSISQTVADDLAINLGINPNKIFNIDGAPIERVIETFKMPSQKYSGKFILMPTGNDLRKNNLKAVQGFEQYLKTNKTDASLIITSHFDDNTRKNLEAYSNNLFFTGNVTEEELRWLYKHAEAVLFVSEYEGLGLPVLEAAEANRPVVCSNIGVFNEISTEAFYYCDHHDPGSIATAIKNAVELSNWERKKALYADILERYSWSKTAHKAVSSLSESPITYFDNKPKIAIFSPSPSGYSDIGKRVLQLHSAMSEYFDIDYFVEFGKTRRDLMKVDYLSAVANVFSAEIFNKNTYKNYDFVIYNIGNSEFHLETIKDSLYLPGYAIFHDTHLKNIFEGELKTYGYLSAERINREEILDKEFKNKTTSFVTSISNRQLGLVVHSDYARNAVSHSLEKANKSPIIRLNLPVAAPVLSISRIENRKIVIGFAGIIHEAKGLNIIELIANNKAFDECKIHIFGLSLVSEETIQRLESYHNVTVDINVTDFEFQTMLKELDVIVNFRKDYRGETSAATLEAMRFGVVPVVRKIGWFDELPNDIVVKASSPEQVITYLNDLVSNNNDLLNKMAIKGQKYVRDNFSYTEYAKQFYNFIKTTTPDTSNYKIMETIKMGGTLNQLIKIIKDSN